MTFRSVKRFSCDLSHGGIDCRLDFVQDGKAQSWYCERSSDSVASVG